MSIDFTSFSYFTFLFSLYRRILELLTAHLKLRLPSLYGSTSYSRPNHAHDGGPGRGNVVMVISLFFSLALFILTSWIPFQLCGVSFSCLHLLVLKYPLPRDVDVDRESKRGRCCVSVLSRGAIVDAWMVSPKKMDRPTSSQALDYFRLPYP